MSVLTTVEATTLVVTLDRPERKNAVDRATAEALRAAWTRFHEDGDLRVMVLTGAHGTFCAGADLKAFDNDIEHPGGPMGFSRWAAEKPVIAAIEGYCVAGGLELALCADLRVAAQGAAFGCLERRFGVPLIDGGTQRLPRVVGLGRALDLMLTGRLIDAAEAERIGLVNRVVDDGSALDHALELAAELAAFPFACLLADRASAYAGLGEPLARGLQIEAERGHAVLAEALQGAAAFAGGQGRHGKSR
ncbi:MAG: crotonase/enoyl-CoA hydratase family protein [Polyangiaceae bacterium]